MLRASGVQQARRVVWRPDTYDPEAALPCNAGDSADQSQGAPAPHGKMLRAGNVLASLL